jgi:uncharacterized protein (DUF58 family)
MPTTRGWALAAAAAASYPAAWLLSYPELLVLAAAATLAVAAAWLRLLRPMPIRAYRDIAPPKVPRGDPALAVLTCAHRGRLGLGPVRAADRCGAGEVVVDLPPLRPGRSHTTSYFLPTTRRGHIPIGPLRLTATDPLGLVRRTRTCGAQLTLFVQPRTVPLAALPSGRMASPEGPRSDRSSGGTIAFHSLRPYLFGDDLRHIHWRTTARTNTLMVRQLVDTILPRTVVLLDVRASAYPIDNDFELAVDVAASVSAAAAASGFPVSVFGGDQRLSDVDDSRGLAGLLDELALVETRPDTVAAGLARALTTVRPARAGGSLTVVTGGGTAGELSAVTATRPHYERVVVVRVGGEPPTRPLLLPLAVLDVADLNSFARAWRRATQ